MKRIIPLLIAFVLQSCNFLSGKSDEKSSKINSGNEKLSTVDYNAIIGKSEIDGMALEILDLGNINLPSGKIIASDPLANSDTIPFSQKVSPGKYPVKVYVAKTPDSGDRYALAQIQFSNKNAVKWVLAVKENENIRDLKTDDSFFGFPVDAGVGSFYYYETAIEYQKFQDRFYKSDSSKNIYDDFFADEFKKSAVDQNDPADIGDWVNYTFPATNLNIVMFHSGFGDGIYPAYWGVDAKGEITSLVIDFFVVDVPEFKK